jgi:hypothetical protein
MPWGGDRTGANQTFGRVPQGDNATPEGVAVIAKALPDRLEALCTVARRPWLCGAWPSAAFETALQSCLAPNSPFPDAKQLLPADAALRHRLTNPVRTGPLQSADFSGERVSRDTDVRRHVMTKGASGGAVTCPDQTRVLQFERQPEGRRWPDNSDDSYCDMGFVALIA